MFTTQQQDVFNHIDSSSVYMVHDHAKHTTQRNIPHDA